MDVSLDPPPPDAVDQDNAPDPSVLRYCPLLPSAVGQERPSRTILPLPFGVIAMFPLEVETIEYPHTFRFQPRVGSLSALTLAIPLPPPPLAVAKDSVPEPLVLKNWPDDPSLDGNA